MNWGVRFTYCTARLAVYCNSGIATQAFVQSVHWAFINTLSNSHHHTLVCQDHPKQKWPSRGPSMPLGVLDGLGYLGLGIIPGLPPLVQGLVSPSLLLCLGGHGLGLLQLLTTLNVLLSGLLQSWLGIILTPNMVIISTYSDSKPGATRQVLFIEVTVYKPFFSDCVLWIKQWLEKMPHLDLSLIFSVFLFGLAVPTVQSSSEHSYSCDCIQLLSMSFGSMLVLQCL